MEEYDEAGFKRRFVTNLPLDYTSFHLMEGTMSEDYEESSSSSSYHDLIVEDPSGSYYDLLSEDLADSDLYVNETYTYDSYDTAYDDIKSFLANLTERDFLSQPLSRDFKLALIILYATIIIVGLLGNSFVVYVVLRNSKMRTVMNLFLLSLAISDGAMAIFSMPMQLVHYLFNEWILGEAMCKITHYFQGVLVVASIFTLTGVAIDRYYAICYPLRARYVHTTRRAVILITVFWLLAYVIMIPQTFIQRLEPLLDVKYDKPIPSIRIATVCAEYLPDNRLLIAYTILYQVILYLTPVIIMIVTYVKIAIQLNKRDIISEMTSALGRDDAKQVREKKRVVKMLALVVLLFAVCWFPYFAAQIYLLVLPYTTQSSRMVMASLQLLGYSNCCINPIIYCLMNEAFKHHLKRTFICCTSRNKPDDVRAKALQPDSIASSERKGSAQASNARSPSLSSQRMSISTKVTSCVPSDYKSSSSRWSSSSKRSSFRSNCSYSKRSSSQWSDQSKMSGQWSDNSKSSDCSKINSCHWSEFFRRGSWNQFSDSTKHHSCQSNDSSKNSPECNFQDACIKHKYLIDCQCDEIQRIMKIPTSDV